MRLRSVASILFFLGSALLLGAAAGAAPARVQLVLDASGSMWGQVDGEPKIAIARGAVREMLDGWDDGVELGLTVYGHRRKGDCADIETLIPAGPADGAAFMTAVEGLSPKGKTPLSEAVRRAAADLRSTEEKASVVLVSDGIETCGADPCAVAAELEASGVDFTVHVVGFDLQQGEDQKLRCIAEQTGGNFWLAGDAAGLTDAFAEVVEVVAAPAPAPPPAAIAPPEPEPAAFEGVKLVPYMSRGGEVIEGGVEWRVLSPEVDFEGNREQRAYHWNVGTQIVTLAPGEHLVQVKYGDVTREERIQVETGNGETFDIVLDAARFKVTAALAPGALELGGVEWRILGHDVDFDGNRPQIAYAWNSPAGHIFTIPAGDYELTAKYGDAAGAVDFSVAPGEQKAVVLPLGAAQLRVFGVLGDAGEPVNGAEWRLLALEEDFEGNRAQIAYSWNSPPGHIFTVPAGSYELITKYGEVTRSAPITVAAGDRKRHTTNLQAAQLSLELLPGADLAALQGVEWRLFDAAGEQAAYNWNTPPGHTFTLPMGTYRVTATGHGFSGETSVTLAEGEQRRLQVMGAPAN